jgi:hypothetical protein
VDSTVSLPLDVFNLPILPLGGRAVFKPLV